MPCDRPYHDTERTEVAGCNEGSVNLEFQLSSGSGRKVLRFELDAVALPTWDKVNWLN
jgi:hypothetical protein